MEGAKARFRSALRGQPRAEGGQRRWRCTTRKRRGSTARTLRGNRARHEWFASARLADGVERVQWTSRRGRGAPRRWPRRQAVDPAPQDRCAPDERRRDRVVRRPRLRAAPRPGARLRSRSEPRGAERRRAAAAAAAAASFFFGLLETNVDGLERRLRRRREVPPRSGKPPARRATPFATTTTTKRTTTRRPRGEAFNRNARGARDVRSARVK